MKAFFHPSQDLHNPQSYFTRGRMRQPQEVPDRTERLLRGLESMGSKVLRPEDQGCGPISDIHDLGYLRFLESAHRRWMEMEDWGEEVMSNIFVHSPNHLKGILAEAARYQADGSSPIGALLEGDASAYAICRPPGHHARRHAAGGFCYLNNAAIAAERLQERFGRVAILDTDVHHGQGIQEIFYDRSDVLYVSIHGDPTNFYPVVTGFEDERGEGEGYGYNINYPLPHGSGEEAFFATVTSAMTDIRLYDPDVLVLCLGFDIYRNDPQARIAVDTESFTRLGQHVAGAGLPVLVVQEGGYDLESLSDNVQAFFRGLHQD